MISSPPHRALLVLLVLFALTSCEDTIRVPIDASGGGSPAIPVGPAPQDLAIGLVNGDPFLDIVTANSDGTISVLLANGDGTFTRTDITIAPGEILVALALADFDQDTMTDLVVGYGTELLVALGDGLGGFTPQTPITMGAGRDPSALFAADVTSDLIPDIVVTLLSPGEVVVLPNDGLSPGTFLGPVISFVGTAPGNVIVVDLNTDAANDIVVTNFGSDSVSIVLQDPLNPGTYFPATTILVGIGPVSVVASELDGNAVLDLAIANQGDGSVTILFGDGGGDFPTSSTGVAGASPAAIIAGEFSGDLTTDYVVADRDLDNVLVAPTDGVGTFPSGTPFPAGDGPVAMAAAFLGADALLDLIVVNGNDSTVTIIENPTAP